MDKREQGRPLKYGVPTVRRNFTFPAPLMDKFDKASRDVSMVNKSEVLSHLLRKMFNTPKFYKDDGLFKFSVGGVNIALDPDSAKWRKRGNRFTVKDKNENLFSITKHESIFPTILVRNRASCSSATSVLYISFDNADLIIDTISKNFPEL